MIIHQEEPRRFDIKVTPGRYASADGRWFADQGDGGRTSIDDSPRPLRTVHATTTDDLTGAERDANSRARAPPVRDRAKQSPRPLNGDAGGCVPKLA